MGVDDGGAPDARGPDPATGRRRHGRDVWCIVALCAASAVLVALAATRYVPFSPFDEHAHADYVLRVAAGDWPRYGDPLTDQAAVEYRCRSGGLAPEPAGDLASCRTQAPDRAALPEQGGSYEAGQPPGYYAATAVVLRLARRVALAGDDVTRMRLAGALWLAIGAVASFAALRLLGTGRALAMAGAAVALAGPGTLHAASSVSNDVTVWAAGGVCLLAGVAWWTRWHSSTRWRSWGIVLLATVGFVGGALKALAVLPIAALVGMLAVLAARERSRRNVLAATAPLAGFVLATAAWVLVVRSWPVDVRSIQPFARYQLDGFPPDILIRSAWALLPPLNPNFTPQPFDSNALSVALTLSGIVQFGIVLLPALTDGREVDPCSRAIGRSLLVVLALAGIGLSTVYVVATHQSADVNPRFALGLVPFLLATALRWLSPSWRRWAALGVLGLPAVIVVASILATA